MTETRAVTTERRGADVDAVRSRTWMLAGALLVLAHVLRPFPPWQPAAATLGLAAALLFATGLQREGGVAGARGATALVIVGSLLFVVMPILDLLAMSTIQIVYLVGVPPEIVLVAFSVILLAAVVGGMVASAVAGIRIGRAGVVPRPWAWLPLPVLLAAYPVAGAMVAGTALSVVAWKDALGEWADVLLSAQVIGGGLLGIVAIAVGLLVRSRR